MKIDFITYSAATNYGAMLQTYGLYSFLVSQGHNVETINYIQDRYDLAAKYVAAAIMAVLIAWTAEVLLNLFVFIIITIAFHYQFLERDNLDN